MKTKKRSRAALAAILSSALVFSMSVGALASDVMGITVVADVPTVTLSDSGNQAVFTLNRADTNLFDRFSAVMPGDTLNQAITVRTPAGNSSDYNIYLYARVHQAEEPVAQMAAEPMIMDVASDAHEDPSLHDPAFMEQLDITVKVGGETVRPFDAGAGILGVSLGRFTSSGTSKDVLVTLEVPIEMGNEFVEANAYIDWFFYAQGIDPRPDPDPDPRPRPDPDPVVPPVIEVPDEEVPLNPMEPEPEPEIEVPNEAVPLDAFTPAGEIPQTGDESTMILWATLTVLSGGALVFLVTGLKKKG